MKNVNPNALPVHLGRRFQSSSYTARGRQVRSRQLKLATTPLCQTKETCFTLTPKCASDSFFSLQTPHNVTGQHQGTAHSQSPRSTETRQGGICSHALGDTAALFTSEHLTPLPWADVSTQLVNSIPGFQFATFPQRLLKQFQTAKKYKSPSHKNVRNISKSSQVKLALVQTQVTN